MNKRLLEGIIDYYEDEEILIADGFDESDIIKWCYIKVDPKKVKK